MADFLEQLKERVLVFDGAMGTSIQAQDLTADDFGGQEGCNEYLVITKPDAVRKVHADFLQVGCDAVETDTFGGTSWVLDEYGLGARTYEINRAAAALAKDVCASFTDKPRFVVGSMGPGTKSPTLAHIRYDEMFAGYELQARALLDGGADVLLVETCFDLLQAKCGVAACVEAMRGFGRRVPLMCQVTMETTGTMLLGSEMSAVIAALEMFPVDVLGLNCATGPDQMTEHVRTLSEYCARYLSVLPNAGLPEMRNGQTYYPLTPGELAEYHDTFTRDLGVNIVGGCCGTTPEHLRAVVERVGGRAPKPRTPEHVPAAASLYAAVPYRQENSFLIVGERTNANGSKAFREKLLAGDWDGCVAMGREQVQEGANVLDVVVDYVGRDGVKDMEEIVSRFATQITAPLMIDSDTGGGAVYETALKHLGGKAIINSINFEDGGKKIEQVLPLCKKYGAALVALTIDEEGQPHDTDGKVRIAKRLYETCVGEWGMKPEDLFFDALTFPLSTGQEEYRKDGQATIEAIRRIKTEMPGVHTILGVSNISFGLKPAARQVLNSVFLHYAMEAGLDAAIVHASKIMPLASIPPEQRELARQIVFDERREKSEAGAAHDPLTAFMALFEGEAGKRTATRKKSLADLPLGERLQRHVIDGQKEGLTSALDEAMQIKGPLAIINDDLLAGMKVVGDLFGSGQMQLPFVLQSAEVMKAAVRHLEPHMEKADQGGKGTVILATVKGDVHDIGKNLVDIILTNNGYRCVNIGIKQPVENVIRAAQENNADAIGLSGLLVKSTVIMREDLEELNARGLAHYPVLLGGAALTRGYVEQDLRAVYRGKVFYGADAFDGLRLMDEVMGHRPPSDGYMLSLHRGRAGSATRAAVALPDEEPQVPVAPPAGDEENRQDRGAAGDGMLSERSRSRVPAECFTFTERSAVAPDAPIPTPPFYGTRVVDDIDLRDVFPYVNEIALFRGQWQFRRGNLSDEEFQALTEKEVRPLFRSWQERVIAENILRPRVVYGYFPANSDKNDLIVYHPDDPDREFVRFTFPRQRENRRLCLADFFAPVDSGRKDVAAFHLVTVGRHASEYARELFARDQYRDYLYLHGLSVETAEGMAEYWHKRIREELGIGGEDSPVVRDLFAQRYRGSRYSFGYPACPRLEDQEKLFALLEPGRIDVTLSDEYQLDPEQSTSALIVHHPEAKYFGVK